MVFLMAKADFTLSGGERVNLVALDISTCTDGCMSREKVGSSLSCSSVYGGDLDIEGCMRAR